VYLRQLAFAEYPERQIDLIVPFLAAGGGSDRVARIVDAAGPAKRNRHRWNFQYKPGAGGAVGSNAIATARNVVHGCI